MVAIPRSKACITCRKRHVKCGIVVYEEHWTSSLTLKDEAKPICTNCLKTGHVCGGYNRRLVFRNVSTAPLPPPSPPLQERRTIVLSVPPTLHLTAFKGDICFAYLFDNFVWRTYGTPWLERAARGQLDAIALDTTRALSLTHFAKGHHQTNLQVEGQLCYGKALRQLIPALSHPTQPNVEALIVPILVLLLYSSLLGDKAGSVSHVKGLMMLLHACGPMRFQNPSLLSAFESCRATLVTMSLVARQRTFLEQPEWRQRPWTGSQLPKTNQCQLVDILVTVPGLLEDMVKHNSSDHFATTRDDLLSRTTEQLEALFRWRWYWELTNSTDVCTNPAPRVSPITQKPPIFKHALQFRTLAQATEVMLYNAVLLWLLGVLWRLNPTGAQTLIKDLASLTQASAGPPGSGQHKGPSIHLPGEATTLRTAAIEICQTFEYHIQHIQRNHDSSLLYLFPIGMAWSVLKDDPVIDFKSWIIDVLSFSDVTKGYVTGDNSSGFGSFYRIPSIDT